MRFSSIATRLGPVVALAALAGGPTCEAAPWQQAASYRLDVTLSPQTRTISGRESLTYVNRSPSALRQLRFHLYHAAARPGSALDRARRGADNWEVAGLSAAQWGACEVESVVAAGRPCSLATPGDPSVGLVDLPRAVAPGESVAVSFRFRDRFPAINVHDGWRGREFLAGEWFPKVCVYDSCPQHPAADGGLGWHDRPYTGRGEFYSDFGDYDVTLTLPASYLVVSTGRLENPGDVLPEEVRMRLRGLGERPVRVWERAAAPDSLRQAAHTWRLRAERVHDFAFAALETWSWEAVRSGGVTVSCVCPPADRAAWTRAAGWSADLLADLSARLGAYPYDHLDVVGTRALGASIEKPQTVWISGAHYRDRHSRRLFEVLAHEIAHQWFYGTVANDELNEAFLDEGLASWLALRAVERRFGASDNLYLPAGSVGRWLVTPDDFRSELWRTELDWEQRGRAEPMVTRSDDFATGEAYARAAYTRAALMMDALDRWLPPGVFESGLRDYAARWSLAHPHAADFRAAIARAAPAPLDSLFAFWMGDPRQARAADAGSGRGPAPGVGAAAGARGVAAQFENGVPRLEARRVDRPTLWWRPALAYDDVDGVGTGARLRLEPAGGAWTATGELVLPWNSPGGHPRPWLDLSLGGRWWAGPLWGGYSVGYTRGEGRSVARALHQVWLQPDPARSPRYCLSAAVERWSLFHPEYLRDPAAWQAGDQWAWDLGLTAESEGRGVRLRPAGELRASLPGGPADFTRLSGELRADWRGAGRDRLNLRVAGGTFARRDAGTGSSGDPAAQELFRLAGAGPLDEFGNPLLRSRGLVHRGGHAVAAGDAAVRGYFDRDLRASRFLAVNAELPLARLAPDDGTAWTGPLDIRLRGIQLVGFYDAAILGGDVTGARAPEDRDSYSDAGLGLALRLLPWNLAARVDFPLWLDQPAPGEHPVALRWVVRMGSLF